MKTQENSREEQKVNVNSKESKTVAIACKKNQISRPEETLPKNKLIPGKGQTKLKQFENDNSVGLSSEGME